MVHSCDPNYQPGQAPSDQEHDASASAAIVAANLLSSARLVFNLDSVFTEYSAQYMVENACPNKVDGQGETDHRCNNLTVKDCLRFALKDGIPRADQWVHLGCMIKPPPSAYTPPLVSMKGELIETMNMEEAFKLLRQQQPVGAKLHVFSPGIDLVGDDGIYLGPCDPSGNARYVGLRDVIICGREKAGEETVAVVKICYKKKLSFIKVSLNVMFMQIANDSGFASNEAVAKPGHLLVDFCVPRLTTE